MNNNRIRVHDSAAVNSDTTQSKTLCEHFRRRKLMWIIFSIIVVISIIIIPIIILQTKKINSGITSIIAQESTTEIIEIIITTEKSIIKTTEQKMELTTEKSTAKTTEQKIELTTEQLFPSFIINNKTKWKKDGTTVAGGNGRGDQLNQFNGSTSMYIDEDDKSIYITDSGNHRIVRWEFDAVNGEIVAGGNGKGNRIDQLNEPLDAILDKKNNSLIICDFKNRRVVRWSHRNKQDQQIMISDIYCWGLAMDNNGDLYVCDTWTNEVKHWKQGDTNGIIVAGGNGEGDSLSQLSRARFIFVDRDYSVYVADVGNRRVMKWERGEKNGTLVARAEVSVLQPNYPVFISAVIVDHMGNIYVSETARCKITRWSPGALKGSAIVDGKECGGDTYHLNGPSVLSFDRQGNLYVVDGGNNRIQKFAIDLD